MPEHPIEALMKTAMESIKEMVDVNTVIGEPIETADGQVIVPVSRVAAGFAVGGSEFDTAGKSENLPFGGGSGAGVSVQPVGFLVVGKENIRMLPVDGNAAIDRLFDLTPQVLEKLKEFMSKGKNGSNKNGSNNNKGNNNEYRTKVVFRPKVEEES